MNRKFAIFAATISFAMTLAGASGAQTVEEFYKGKDVRILIGADVGGTYGLFAQLAARHMRKHIPGQPNLVLQTMPGAGGITALNHSYNVAPKDGTLMHLVHAEVLFESLLTTGVRFNARDYQWIGRFADADMVGVTSKRSGVKSLDDARTREVTMGATGKRSVTAYGPLMLNRTAGTRFKVIAGYKGTSEISIAMERGEVDGVALAWAGVRTIHAEKLKSGELVVLFAVAESRIQELPHVPAVNEFGRDDNEKTFLSIYTSTGTIGRSLAFPPGVPRDRVNALRTAFEKTIRDPAFLAEVKDKDILFAPMLGAQLEEYVDILTKTPASRIHAARRIFEDLLSQP